MTEKLCRFAWDNQNSEVEQLLTHLTPPQINSLNARGIYKEKRERKERKGNNRKMPKGKRRRKTIGNGKREKWIKNIDKKIKTETQNGRVENT